MSFTQTNVKYFRPNITLESHMHIEADKWFYIYNYKGVHFRLFQNKDELNRFLEFGDEPALDFGRENKLDKYLENFC